MTAQELVGEIWRIGLMDPVVVRMENAVALVEADRRAVRRECSNRALAYLAHGEPDWMNWKPEEDRL